MTPVQALPDTPERIIEKPLDVRGRGGGAAQDDGALPVAAFNWSKGCVSMRALQESLAQVEVCRRATWSSSPAHHPLVEGGTRMDQRRPIEGRRRWPGARPGRVRHAVLTGPCP